MEMLNLLVTTAVLLVLTTQCVDSATTDTLQIKGQAHVLMKVSAVPNGTEIVWIRKSSR